MTFSFLHSLRLRRLPPYVRMSVKDFYLLQNMGLLHTIAHTHTQYSHSLSLAMPSYHTHTLLSLSESCNAIISYTHHSLTFTLLISHCHHIIHTPFTLLISQCPHIIHTPLTVSHSLSLSSSNGICK